MPRAGIQRGFNIGESSDPVNFAHARISPSTGCLIRLLGPMVRKTSGHPGPSNGVRIRLKTDLPVLFMEEYVTDGSAASDHGDAEEGLRPRIEAPESIRHGIFGYLARFRTDLSKLRPSPRTIIVVGSLYRIVIGVFIGKPPVRGILPFILEPISKIGKWFEVKEGEGS
jgi:hypothetical protein